MEASLLIPSLLVNCTISSLVKSPNQCCKLSRKIFTFTFTIDGSVSTVSCHVRTTRVLLFFDLYENNIVQLTSTLEKTRLRDLSKTLPRFRDPANILRDHSFSRYHSLCIYFKSVKRLRFYMLVGFSEKSTFE